MMQCPTCPSSTLEACFSQGIEIDVCRSCSGVWLDRGELDKLVDMAAPSTLLASSDYTAPQDGVPISSVSTSPATEDDDDDDDDRKKSKKHSKSKKRKKKKRKLKSLGDRLEDILDDVLDL